MFRSVCLAPIACALLCEVILAQGDGAAAREKIAREFLLKLAKKDYAAAHADFEPVMKKLLPEEKLKALWTEVESKVGKFKKLGKARHDKAGPFDVVFVTCVFEGLSLDARVVFDKDRKITGLGFTPAKSDVVYMPPAYVKKDSFREIDIVINDGGVWPLPGTLSVPQGDGPFPAIVIVHGSGPQDRDGNMGPNQLYKDIAWGLSSRGFAVLRFDKRTKAHPVKAGIVAELITVKEDVVDDALAAVRLVKGRKEVDPKRIYVLGHSLGGQMAPRLAMMSKDIHGLVILAGTARPFEDVIHEQLIYLISIEKSLSDKEKAAALKDVDKQAARTRDPKLSPDTPTKDLLLGMPARYWLSLRGYSPPETAKKLDHPMLILQGERDYQITMDDFRVWSAALKDRKNATLKSYADLNHAFMTGKGKATPAEYEQPGHVAAEVIDDIATWLKR